MNSFGDYIRTRRKDLKLSQSELAEKSDLTPNFIGLLERGQQEPSLHSLVKLATALNESVLRLTGLLFPEVGSEVLNVDEPREKYLVDSVGTAELAQNDQEVLTYLINRLR